MVHQPEAIAYGGGCVVVVVKPDDFMEIIDLFLVPSLEVAPAQAGSQGDWRGSRRLTRRGGRG